MNAATSTKIYRQLLRAYPQSFRDRFGPTMCETFEDALDAARRRGFAALSAVWFSAVIDAWRLGLAERFAARRNSRRKDEQRDVTRSMSSFLSLLAVDVKYGLRMLGKHRGLTLNAVTALALGIGLTTTMFSIVYGSVFRGLPFERPDELVHFERENLEQGRLMSVSYHDYVEWRAQQRSFVDLGAFVEAVIHMTGSSGRAERHDGVYITHTSFELLQVTPFLGSLFTPQDDVPGAQTAIVLGHAIWQRQFGADSGIVGRSLDVNGEQATIIGVMPRGFGFPIAENFWLPLRLDPDRVQRGGGRLDVFGRLRSGVTFEQARTEFETIGARLAREYAANDGISPQLKTFREEYVGQDFMDMLLSMFIVATLVLAVACANVANLLVARTGRRAREIAVRSALGASRIRIVSQLLTETFFIALVGAIVGLGLAQVAVDWFETAWIRGGALQLPHGPQALFWWDFQIDAVPLAFVLGLTLMATLVSGIVPAIKVSSADVAQVLKDDSRATSSMRLGLLAKTLIVGELSLTTGLLVAAGLTVKSALRTTTVGAGLSSVSAITARVGLPDRRTGVFDAEYPDIEARYRFWDRLVDQLQRQPGVVAATVTGALPVTRSGSVQLAIAGRSYASDENYPTVRGTVVTSGYFETFDAGVISGRAFDARDQPGSEPVALVNQSFAQKHFPDEDPLFQQIKLGNSASEDPWMTVVGIVPDLWVDGPRNETPQGIYLPLTQGLSGDSQLRLGFWGLTFMNLAAVMQPGVDGAEALRGAVAAIDRDVPVYGIRSMKEVVSQRLVRYRVYGTFFFLCGVAALLLASIGLYGVMAFSVTSRTSEIGIRMALGAHMSTVVRSVLAQGLRHIAAGIAVGAIVSVWLSRGLNQMLYQVEPWDTVVFVVVVGTLIATGILACAVPAFRAAAIDPATAVRCD